MSFSNDNMIYDGVGGPKGWILTKNPPQKLKSIKMLNFTKIVKIFIKKIKEKGIGVSLDLWKWVKAKLERKDKKSQKKICPEMTG